MRTILLHAYGWCFSDDISSVSRELISVSSSDDTDFVPGVYDCILFNSEFFFFAFDWVKSGSEMNFYGIERGNVEAEAVKTQSALKIRR